MKAISREAGEKIVDIASPLSPDWRVALLPFLLGIAALCYFGIYDLPLLSLDGRWFTFCINYALTGAFLLTVAEAGRLLLTWLELKRLLGELSGLRLRRTFARLRAIEANSLWSVSGNVQRVQYHFFRQQLDAVTRLSILLRRRSQDVDNAATCGQEFDEHYAAQMKSDPNWGLPVTVNGATIREVFATAVADMLNNLLVRRWKLESTSLCLEGPTVDPEKSGRNQVDMYLSPSAEVRAAEEFVCFHYIAFIQVILARMRTMIVSMALLFIAVCAAISFYPFVPRTQVSVWMLADLALIGAAVLYVYAGMERDETLSYITNTKTGHLSAEFWIRAAAFLIGPVVGILATQFPVLADSLLSWLQPGLTH